MSKRAWTDEQLAGAVAAAAATTYQEVCERLGVAFADVERVRRRIRMLRLDTSHLARLPRGRTGKTRWTDDELRAAVASSRSIAQVLVKLGLKPAGGNYDSVQRRIAALALDTANLLGMGWNRGGRTRDREAPLDEILVAGRWTSSHKLKLRLFREGKKQPACERCGWCERAPDGRVPLELDHRNGDKLDNRLENLRVLCPNCHALQPTHRGLNQRRRRSAGGGTRTRTP